VNPTFVRGSSQRPRGHALAFFTAPDRSRLYATYLIVSPVPFDIGRYLPPILAGQASQFELGPFASVALPPIPEEVPGMEHLEQLADARDDDLIDAGMAPMGGPAEALPAVQDLVQWYRAAYEAGSGAALASIQPGNAEQEAGDTEIDADDLLYGVLGDRERVAELSKLIGSLRYGLEVHDGSMVQGAEERMRKVARHLPDSFRALELIKYAAEPGERSARLAELFLQRCFRLVEEDYAAVGEIERQIGAV